MTETTQVICAWPLSKQYGLGTRILYYVLVATCILAKHQEWLRNACIASAMLVPAVASLHSIVLAAVHVDYAVDMDIYGAFQLCSIAILTAPVILSFSRRTGNFISVWTFLLLIGMLSLTVEFFRTQVHTCVPDGSDNPIDSYNLWGLPYRNTECDRHCGVSDGVPYSPIRQEEASIYVIPQSMTLGFRTVAILAAGTTLVPVIVLILAWEDVLLGPNWRQRNDRKPQQTTQTIGHTTGERLGLMVIIDMKVENIVRNILGCIYVGFAIGILISGEINIWMICETERFSTVGQWPNLVATALVIHGSAFLVPDSNGRNETESSNFTNSAAQGSHWPLSIKNNPEGGGVYRKQSISHPRELDAKNRDMTVINTDIVQSASLDGHRAKTPTHANDFQLSPRWSTKKLTVRAGKPLVDFLGKYMGKPATGQVRAGERRQNKLWLWFKGIYSTPPFGYERIFYHCGCGELSYLDVKELSPGGMQRFRQRLTASSRTAMMHPQSPQNSTSPTLPAQAYLRNNTNSQHLPTQFQGPSSPLPEDYQATSIESQTSSSNSQRPIPQYLLLCVNTKSSTTLLQLEISSISNDQYLFEKISQEYQRVRRDYEWHISRIIPSSVSRLLYTPCLLFPPLQNLYNSFQILRNALGKAHVHTIASGDFVRFQLIPIGERCCPRWFRKREVPPEEEIRAKR
ncbi:hypothetical protein F5Y12DRAFT_763192 [Xylaria sp. FL1777]|nr:hypothetical protein F5Y12DRAFT_763192 [Xylaria sp. FL1777]